MRGSPRGGAMSARGVLATAAATRGHDGGRRDRDRGRRRCDGRGRVRQAGAGGAGGRHLAAAPARGPAAVLGDARGPRDAVGQLPHVARRAGATSPPTGHVSWRLDARARRLRLQRRVPPHGGRAVPRRTPGPGSSGWRSTASTANGAAGTTTSPTPGPHSIPRTTSSSSTWPRSAWRTACTSTSPASPGRRSGLLGVRDLIFTRYRNPATGRFFDARSADMSRTVDLGRQRRRHRQPAGARDCPAPAERRPPDRSGAAGAVPRRPTRGDAGADRPAPQPAPRRRPGGSGDAPAGSACTTPLQTDFGHTIKSHEMIHNANQVFADRPWDGLASDRDVLLAKAWDEPAARWHDDLVDFASGAVEPDSPWWVHDEADQTLAALDLREDFARSEWLARSAQGWLDAFVDPEFPHETWQRPLARPPDPGRRRRSPRAGKNMYHVFEHTLVMYLHGRAMEGRAGRAALRAARGPRPHRRGRAVLVRRHDRAPRGRRSRGPAARAPARHGRAVRARRGARPALPAARRRRSAR